MTRIRVDTLIDAPPEEVWAAIEDVSTHVEWMAEAVEIRFLTDQRAGAGTTIECDTRVGPFTTTDVLRFVSWDPPMANEGRMGVEHRGAVTGKGAFTLEAEGTGRTRFVWEEDLRFPWWIGPAGWWLGARLLSRVWTRNLQALKRKVEGK